MKNTDGGCFSAINSKANKFYSKGVLVLFCLIYCLVLFRRLGKNLSFNYNPAVQIILMACWAFLTAAVIFVLRQMGPGDHTESGSVSLLDAACTDDGSAAV